MASGAENDRLDNEFLDLLREPGRAADERVRQLVSEHRDASVRGQPVGDGDPPRPVVAQPLDALELPAADRLAELARQGLERRQQP